MISKKLRRSPIALGLAAALLSMSSMVGLAAPKQDALAKQSGELTASGNVTVDGAKAISGATVFTESTITTADKSSAIVTLPNIGRVELLPNSSLKLGFNEAGITSSLDAGRLIVSTNQGAAASIVTKDATVVAENTQPASFTVDIECGNTHVQTRTGIVALREGSAAKQIAAGQDATAGAAVPGTRCTRLTDNRGGAGLGALSGGALAALLIAAAGAIGAVVYSAVNSGSDTEVRTGGGVIIVSPV